jgi:hypothetical protein
VQWENNAELPMEERDKTELPKAKRGYKVIG